MEVDLEGRMGNIFWSDARSRRAYGFFCGDAVVFDMTFNMNRYGMVFAPLLGVNIHQQTMLFGCAFITSETTDSFVWLFEEFKKAMPGEPPKIIITDQDVAMSKAILEMFEREEFISLLCLFELLEQDETHCRYKVSERVNSGGTRMKELVHDKDVDKAYYSCKGFEFWGFELLEKSFEDVHGKLTRLVSSRAHIEEEPKERKTDHDRRSCPKLTSL
ncbi:hypothetical protein L3X38_003302 [Prunus dulcis]|uniref:MULE transposase domain-containing protein n=1 Tax=Prunus dulcis TaxID=3755 RepID=A0AAD4ZLT3_PRUDU|nr:hypothetical protein L3X38_003302 [Prunus dulcis]